MKTEKQIRNEIANCEQSIRGLNNQLKAKLEGKLEWLSEENVNETLKDKEIQLLILKWVLDEKQNKKRFF